MDGHGGIVTTEAAIVISSITAYIVRVLLLRGSVAYCASGASGAALIVSQVLDRSDVAWSCTVGTEEVGPHSGPDVTPQASPAVGPEVAAEYCHIGRRTKVRMNSWLVLRWFPAGTTDSLDCLMTERERGEEE